MAPPSTKLPATDLVAVTVAGESTVVVALAVLLALFGSPVPADAVLWSVRAPAMLGAGRVMLRVAENPFPSEARFHRPVAGL